MSVNPRFRLHHKFNEIQHVKKGLKREEGKIEVDLFSDSTPCPRIGSFSQSPYNLPSEMLALQALDSHRQRMENTFPSPWILC